MSAQHTPGPWQIKDDYTPEGRITVIANVDGEYFTDSPAPRMTCDVIAVCEDEYGERLENAAANARLIAAAPELLEAAKQALIATEFGIEPDCDLAVQLRAAIAKATGQ